MLLARNKRWAVGIIALQSAAHLPVRACERTDWHGEAEPSASAMCFDAFCFWQRHGLIHRRRGPWYQKGLATRISTTYLTSWRHCGTAAATVVPSQRALRSSSLLGHPYPPPQSDARIDGPARSALSRPIQPPHGVPGTLAKPVMSTLAEAYLVLSQHTHTHGVCEPGYI
jgi:hypothetical protein